MSEDSSHSAESVESSVGEVGDEVNGAGEEEAEEEEEEGEGEGEGKEENNKKKVNPWETPRQEPVDGIVQPRVIPPVGKPTRHTNQLDYLLNTVLKDALKHKHSWPFHNPVDAVKLAIPEYHKVVIKPMDLRTIEKRLKNTYYYSAKEAIEDLMTMFNNCYTFNPPHYGVYSMAKGLEEYLLGRLIELPEGEVEIPRPSAKRGPKGRGGAKNVGSRGTPTSSKRKLPEGTLTPEDQHVIDHFHRATRAVSLPDEEEVLKHLDEMGSSSKAIKVETVSRESSVVSIQQKDADSSIDAHDGSDILATTSASESTPKQVTKGVKRKADTTTTDDEPGGKMAARRESTRPIKKPNLFIDYGQLLPRQKGKIPESLKFCQKIIQELLSKKYKSFAWPFYEPVDVEALNLTDYYDIISQPMDLGTVKKKLESRQYINAQEFADDIRLICSNCSTYNPAGTDIHNHGLELSRVFEKKFSELPLDDDSHDTSNTSNLTIQTEGNEDEKINNYLNMVKSEQKKCAEKLELLRSFGEVLYDVAMQRKDAKLRGETEPVLTSYHYSQLEKLGLIGKSGPLSQKQEVVSPAVSVRLSSRAPVPKVFDDVKMEMFAPKAASRKNARASSSAAASVTAGSVPSTPITAAPPPVEKVYSGRGRRPGSKNKPKQPPKKEYEFDSDDEAMSQSLSYAEKFELSRIISMFPVNRVNDVLKIIENRETKLNHEPTTGRDEMEIDFEKLDTITLRELQAYVYSLLAKEKKQKKLMPIKNPVEAEKKKREIQRELESLNAPIPSLSGVDVVVNKEAEGYPSPKALLNKPSTSTAPCPANDSSSDSSDSSDDSSSSSSSSDSDSDSESAGPRLDELTSRKKGNENPMSGRGCNNGFGRVPLIKPASSKAKQSMPPPAPVSQLTVAKPEPEGPGMTEEDILARSHIHSGAVPIIETPKVSAGGIGVTILDSLLPPTPAKNNGNSPPNRSNDACRPMMNQREEAWRFSHDEMERRKPPVVKTQAQIEQERREYEEEEARIRHLQEESRRKRALEKPSPITEQMEMMANFEATF